MLPLPGAIDITYLIGSNMVGPRRIRSSTVRSGASRKSASATYSTSYVFAQPSRSARLRPAYGARGPRAARSPRLPGALVPTPQRATESCRAVRPRAGPRASPTKVGAVPRGRSGSALPTEPRPSPGGQRRSRRRPVAAASMLFPLPPDDRHEIGHRVAPERAPPLRR